MKTFFSFLLFAFPIISYAQHPIDVQHYRFEIELSDQSDLINGKATITVKLLEDASQVKFDLVSPEDEKGMRVFQVKEKDKLLTYVQSNDIVHINLANPGKKGEIRTFEID